MASASPTTDPAIDMTDKVSNEQLVDRIVLLHETLADLTSKVDAVRERNAAKAEQNAALREQITHMYNDLCGASDCEPGALRSQNT